MPQMSPLNWMILFIYFTMTFLMINTFNYFYINFSNKIQFQKSKIKKLNWKW